jgi:hypothetical protein
MKNRFYRLLVTISPAFILMGTLQLGCGSATPPPPPPSSTPPPAVDQEAVSSRRALRAIKLEMRKTQQITRLIEESFKDGKLEDVAEHAESIVGISQRIQDQSIDLRESDADMILLLVEDVQHAAHELEEASARRSDSDAHHAYENLTAELSSMEERVSDM